MPQITLRGIGAMQGRLNVVRTKLQRESRQAVRNEIKKVFAVTQQRVPQKEGVLKATGKTRDTVVKGHNVGSEIEYSGPQALALEMHESSASPGTWKGKTLKLTTPGTSVRYVGGPLQESESGMLGRLAGDMKL